MNTNDKLDTVLTQHLHRDYAGNTLSVKRVLAALEASPLPRQKRPFVFEWPAFLLRWDFTPSWPRVTALASCAAIGFLVGIAGFDATFDQASANAQRRADVASLLGETESEVVR